MDTKTLEAKNKQAKDYLAKLYGVPTTDVYAKAHPRERDTHAPGSTVVTRELYYTEIALEVRIPGPGLIAERKAAAAAQKTAAKAAKPTRKGKGA